MKCPVCGEAELVRQTRDLVHAYRGEETKLRRVTGDYCPACGEVVLDAAEGERVSALVGEFNRRVNAGIVDPSFVARVRRKLQLDQREAAEIFGGGVNAFSRYETGKALPSVALVKLLKVLDRHPELLDEVRAA
ncbi:type II toxin-antitoxin system MqsA family antitoxin [Arenimonas metalli]|uniref:type II toxin-antitoxin system MqsA family antitoxin n=1 Tax=Arenimonas metalli TaxID=948077 RepID=UPI000558582A|nr:type II toxin-antitoxin system MqsA family antitoxin [Arenimonas metalli]